MNSSFVFRSSRIQYPKFSYVFLEKPMSSYSGRAGRRNNNIPENRYYSKAQAGISISLVDEDLLLPLLPCSAQVRFRLNSKWIIGNSCFRSTALHCIVRYIQLEFTSDIENYDFQVDFFEIMQLNCHVFLGGHKI